MWLLNILCQHLYLFQNCFTTLIGFFSENTIWWKIMWNCDDCFYKFGHFCINFMLFIEFLFISDAFELIVQPVLIPISSKAKWVQWRWSDWFQDKGPKDHQCPTKSLSMFVCLSKLTNHLFSGKLDHFKSTKPFLSIA